MAELRCIGNPKHNFRVSRMRNIKIAEKDFEDWAEMARQDPASFEQMRLAAIDEYIASVPAQQRERLRRLQWRIDQERRLARTPMNACIRISRMMWENVLGRGGLRERFVELSGLLQAHTGTDVASPPEQDSAEVLVFARPRAY